MQAGTILIVDDNKSVLTSLELLLEDEFEGVETASNPNSILSVLDSRPVDLVLLDMNFSAGVNTGNEGLFWLRRIREIAPELPVIMLTAYGDVELAVRALKGGAADFVLKPWDNDNLIGKIRAALHERKSSQLVHPVERPSEPAMIIGHSPVMMKLIKVVTKVAKTDANVLITGENGTGKEMLAREIHRLSLRSGREMVNVDMGAVSESLFESELFGHERGAFTDARESRPGKFEAAHGSTLFLDEINSMPLFLQSKLLRVLQDGSFRSLGGSETKRTNVKIIAATNVEPLEAIEKGQLRRDIYYRLSMMSIRIPPLRERKADIGHFVKFYVNKHNGTFHKQVQYVSKDLLKKLEEYDWPGNVRELEHVIVYGMSMVDETSALLQYKDIKGKLLLEKQADRKKTPESLEEVPKLCSSLREAVAAYEEKLIWQALEAAHGNISEAARILDVPRQTLQRKASQLRGEKAKEKQEKEI